MGAPGGVEVYAMWWQLVEAAEGAGGAEAAGVEARELGAVLAYLQREVPSLVALPPNELRSLVLQVHAFYCMSTASSYL